MVAGTELYLYLGYKSVVCRREICNAFIKLNSVRKMGGIYIKMAAANLSLAHMFQHLLH